MALTQQKFREIVLQLLYSQDVGHPNDEAMIELIMGELSVTKKNVRLAQEKVHGILKAQAEIDALITSVSTSYTFERIQTVTKNILRLSLYELFFEKEVPPKVSIAEAIRLSRKFSTPESASFVNAILDNLYQTSLGTKVDNKSIEKQGQELIDNEKASAEAALEHLAKKPVENDDDS